MDTWKQDNVFRDIRIHRRPRDSHPAHRASEFSGEVSTEMGSDGRAGYDDAGTGTSLEGWCVQVQGQGRSCKDTQSSVAGGKVH